MKNLVSQNRLKILAAVLIFLLVVLVGLGMFHQSTLPTETEAQTSVLSTHPECMGHIQTISKSVPVIAPGATTFETHAVICDVANIEITIR